ncbi:MAG: DUF302 domain-containing protein [Nitrospirota bacterium]|nr:DUF302 domain-containing protein [Nitrospirota bacterium]
MTNYGIERNLKAGYEQAVEQVTAALKEQGFGIITSIDVKATMKAKLDRDFRRYVILGACNPEFAWQALNAEPGIGLLLPCNVVVEEVTGGGSRASAIDPETLLGVTGRDDLKDMALEVKTRITRALDKCV